MDYGDAMRMLVPLGALGLVMALVWSFCFRAPKVFLNRERKRAQIIDIVELSHDVKRMRISLGHKSTLLGLPVGKHIVIHSQNPQKCLDSKEWNGKPDPDKGNLEIERKYTPVTGDECPGQVDIVFKIYRPGTVTMPDGKEVTWSDGGKGSLYLDSKKVGDFLEISGPVGIHQYLGRGVFKVPGRTVTATHVGMMAGGTGITPMLQVVAYALRDNKDTCKFSLLYANKTKDDILCRDLLDDLEQTSGGRFKVSYTLDFPPAGWNEKAGQYEGFINQDMIKAALPGPSADTLIVMCGPPPMIEFACKKNLDALGFDKTAMLTF